MTLENPNYTQVPNIILDSLHELKPSELKCILAITRKTIGWHLRKEKLSITYLMSLTGLSNRAVIDACKSLATRGWIERHRVECDRGFTYEYSLKLEPIPTSEKMSPVKNSHGSITSEKMSPHDNSSPVTHEKMSPLPVKNSHGSKETPLKETLEKESNTFSPSERKDADDPGVAQHSDPEPSAQSRVPRNSDDQAIIETPVEPQNSGKDQGSANFSPEENTTALEPWQAVTPSGRIVSDDFARRSHLANDGKVVHPPELNLLFERGLGAIWVGPRSYNWSEGAIALAKQRKRDLKQDESDAAAQDYISNLIISAQQSGQWMKVELFHDQVLERTQRREQVEQEQHRRPEAIEHEPTAAAVQEPSTPPAWFLKKHGAKPMGVAIAPAPAPMEPTGAGGGGMTQAGAVAIALQSDPYADF